MSEAVGLSTALDDGETLAYERAALKALGLPHPDDAKGGRTFFHVLGDVIPADSEDVVSRLSKRRRRDLQAMIWKAANSGEWSKAAIDALPYSPFVPDSGHRSASENLLFDLEGSYGLLSYEYYLRNFKDGHPKLQNHHRKGDKKPLYRGADRDDEIWKETTLYYAPEDARWNALTSANNDLADRLTPDLAGYLAYVEAV